MNPHKVTVVALQKRRKLSLAVSILGEILLELERPPKIS